MLNGLTYFNIHSVNFGGGEIRGQITVAPEPASLALVGLGVVGGAVIARKKRASKA